MAAYLAESVEETLSQPLVLKGLTYRSVVAERPGWVYIFVFALGMVA